MQKLDTEPINQELTCESCGEDSMRGFVLCEGCYDEGLKAAIKEFKQKYAQNMFTIVEVDTFETIYEMKWFR